MFAEQFLQRLIRLYQFSLHSHVIFELATEFVQLLLVAFIFNGELRYLCFEDDDLLLEGFIIGLFIFFIASKHCLRTHVEVRPDDDRRLGSIFSYNRIVRHPFGVHSLT